jgi:hypothetical protein
VQPNHYVVRDANRQQIAYRLIGGKYRFLQVAKASLTVRAAKARLTVQAAKPSQTLEAAKASLTVSRSSRH